MRNAASNSDEITRLDILHIITSTDTQAYDDVKLLDNCKLARRKWHLIRNTDWPSAIIPGESYAVSLREGIKARYNRDAAPKKKEAIVKKEDQSKFVYNMRVSRLDFWLFWLFVPVLDQKFVISLRADVWSIFVQLLSTRYMEIGPPGPYFPKAICDDKGIFFRLPGLQEIFVAEFEAELKVELILVEYKKQVEEQTVWLEKELKREFEKIAWRINSQAKEKFESLEVQFQEELKAAAKKPTSGSCDFPN
jgi:hypothetical protein